MNEKDGFFFQNLLSGIACAVRASEYLLGCFKSYETADISDALSSMHKIEHEGDICRHEMTSALAKAFMTPLEREDLATLSCRIDDITDALEDVLLTLRIFEPKTVLPSVIAFGERLISLCRKTEALLFELPNYRKSKLFRSLIIDINVEEEGCDRLFLESMCELHRTRPPIDYLLWKEVFQGLERCADACEDVADAAELAVLKNS